jgi:hypothetical protein
VRILSKCVSRVRCGYVAGGESPHCSSRRGVAPADVLTELSGRFLSHRSMDSMELDPKLRTILEPP